METTYGKVVSVETRNLAEPTTSAASIGATSLAVADAGTFNEGGGYVKVAGALLQYTAANETTNTLTLAVALVAAVEAQELVEFYPPQPIKVALVDLGDDGDPVPATVPHALVENLPDGLRGVDQYESVELGRRGLFEFLVVDVKGKQLATGVISPDRLAVGVVDNLIIDPNFLSATWQPTEPWAILGPDATYTDANYARSTYTGGAGTLFEALFPLTPLIPVEPGQQVRMSAHIRHNAAAETSSPAVSRFGFRAWFFSPAGALTVGVADPVEWVLENMAVDTWEKIEASFTVPAGCTGVATFVYTAYQTAGTIDVIKPYVSVLSSRVQSAAYLPGDAGFSLDDEVSQVPDLNVLGTVGADDVSANSMYIGGEDVEALIEAKANGLQAYGWSFNLLHTAAISTPEVICYEFSVGSIKAGRAYEARAHGHFSNTVATDTFDFRLRYTTDGTAPTITSAIVPGALARHNGGPAGSLSNSFYVEGELLPIADAQIVRIALTMIRAAGTGTGTMQGTDTNRRVEFKFRDEGRFSLPIGTTTSQKSKSAGGADAAPTQDYVTDWPCIWSRAYDQANATLPGDPDDIHEGYKSLTLGSTKSLFGFDDADIRAKLTGATIYFVWLYFRVKESALQSGTTFHFGTGNMSTKPASYNVANVSEFRATLAGCKPGAVMELALSSTIGDEFRTGTSKALQIGDSTPVIDPLFRGRIYGPGSGAGPVLRIMYVK